MLRHPGLDQCRIRGCAPGWYLDHAIALALATVRGLRVLDRGLRAGQPSLEPATPIRQFSTLRFGVLGFGRIGRATARKAAGIGFDVATSDIRLEPGTVTEEGWPALSFTELLQRSDVLSVHMPLDPSTHHLLDAAALAQLPAGAVVVNTPRGGVVDTDAIAAALASGHLQGAGLDVFEDEPLPVDHPLTSFDRCILTGALTSRGGFWRVRREVACGTPWGSGPAVCGREPVPCPTYAPHLPR